MLTLEMIQDAKKTLEGVARVTPLYESAFINPNANVFIKCENMQVTGSFKLRGAYVKTLTPPPVSAPSSSQSGQVSPVILGVVVALEVAAVLISIFFIF